MSRYSRRRFLEGAGAAGLLGLAGCLGYTIEKTSRDSDGDGVIDAEDYAPRDEAVQNKSDVGGTTTPTGPRDSFEDGRYEPRWTVNENRGTIEVAEEGFAGDRSLKLQDGNAGGTGWAVDLEHPVASPVTFGTVFSAWVRTDRIGPADERAYQVGSEGEPFARIGLRDGAVVIAGDAMEAATLWSGPSPDTWYRFELEVIDDGRIRFGVRDADEITIQSVARDASRNSAYAHEHLLAGDASGATPAVWFDDVGPLEE